MLFIVTIVMMPSIRACLFANFTDHRPRRRKIAAFNGAAHNRMRSLSKAISPSCSLCRFPPCPWIPFVFFCLQRTDMLWVSFSSPAFFLAMVLAILRIIGAQNTPVCVIAISATITVILSRSPKRRKGLCLPTLKASFERGRIGDRMRHSNRSSVSVAQTVGDSSRATVNFLINYSCIIPQNGRNHQCINLRTQMGRLPPRQTRRAPQMPKPLSSSLIS
jgi:hypothetical protein